MICPSHVLLYARTQDLNMKITGAQPNHKIKRNKHVTRHNHHLTMSCSHQAMSKEQRHLLPRFSLSHGLFSFILLNIRKETHWICTAVFSSLSFSSKINKPLLCHQLRFPMSLFSHNYITLYVTPYCPAWNLC